MWGVNPPEAVVKDVATRSAKRVRDKALAASIRQAIPRLTTNHDTLCAALDAGRIHEQQPSHYAVADLTDAELRKLYEQQLAHPNGAARSIYDELISRARHRLCSYCQHGEATTLDHFLPKSWIAGLAIEPWNLIPACQQCNKKLNAFQAQGDADSMFHPYHEGVDERWLYAELMEDEPAVLRFAARPPSTVDELTARRIVAQFRTLGLDLMYSAVSSRDIEEAKTSVSRSVRSALKLKGQDRLPHDVDAVREVLLETASDAFSVDPNSRRGAAYEALAASDWFCTVEVDRQ